MAGTQLLAAQWWFLDGVTWPEEKCAPDGDGNKLSKTVQSLWAEGGTVRQGLKLLPSRYFPFTTGRHSDEPRPSTQGPPALTLPSPHGGHFLRGVPVTTPASSSGSCSHAAVSLRHSPDGVAPG